MLMKTRGKRRNRETMAMLIDTTLREGAQLFGAYFTNDMKRRIVAGLLKVGLDEIELGWVGQEGLEDFAPQARSMARKHGGRSRLSVWSPCREKDIRAAARLGVERVNIGVPASDAHMRQRLGLDREGLLERLGTCVLLARLVGIAYVSVGLEDVSRADEEFALRAALVAKNMGALRVRLSDSLGVWAPHQAQRTVARFRDHLSIDLAVHCHNDFGMATGNAACALAAGADYADVSVLGIGERSGIAATEELAAHLTLKEKSHAYSTKGLRALCAFVATAADIQIPRTKSVAGEDIFSCESGLHAHALSKSPDLFEPYSPEAIGAGRRIAVGGKSGRAAVRGALERLGHGMGREGADIARLAKEVRRVSTDLRRPLTSEELLRLAKVQ